MIFTDILGPLPEFAAILAREARVRRGALRCPPGDLVAVRDLDRLLRSRTVRAADLRIAADNSIITPVEYTATGESSGGVLADYAVADRVYRYFDAGATLIWPHLQRFVPALFALARDAADVVGTTTWVDGCLTPPGRMDLAIHDRPVEIIVVQLEGVRRWRVWPTASQHSDSYNFSDPNTLGDAIVDTVLEPGDVLYIPSHSPYVGDYGNNLSLHVSLTFRQPTWRNLLASTVDVLLLDDDFLDRPLPGDVTGGRVAAQRDLLLRKLANLEPEQEAGRLSMSSARDTAPLLGVLPGTAALDDPGHFATMAAADRLHLDDVVEVDPSCTVTGSEVTVGAISYRLSTGLADALRHLKNAGRRLPVGVVLDGLTAEPERTARALARAGILRRVEARHPRLGAH